MAGYKRYQLDLAFRVAFIATAKWLIHCFRGSYQRRKEFCRKDKCPIAP